ncbi:ABC transporter ATP-binding protein [Vampirovibrio sp.]|uniref:ABC transporter ATP-binding protein n=1 Tax=Vampirovibrio sp. TaxID=2717857 RepID=UPI003593E3EA
MLNPFETNVLAPLPDGETLNQAIRVQGLSKRFKGKGGGVEALKGVSFDVEREKVFAILGPNGAGKTTLLRLLTTIMRPTSGMAHIEGFELGRQDTRIRQLIGIVAQDNHFDRYLSVWQNLVLHAQLHGLEKPVYEKRLQELLEQVGLYERRHDYLDHFSGGMQRRVALIRALIHRPKLLFLDEPSTGLDPAARLEIWETIQGLKQETTVILTTHYMEEADRLSDQIMILNYGEVVMVGTPQALKSRISPPDVYELFLNEPLADLYQQKLAPWISEVTLLDRNALRFRLGRREDLNALMAQIVPQDLKSLGLAQADLETVYLTVAGQSMATFKAGSGQWKEQPE